MSATAQTAPENRADTARSTVDDIHAATTTLNSHAALAVMVHDHSARVMHARQAERLALHVAELARTLGRELDTLD